MAQPSVKGKLIQTLPQPTHQYVLHRSLSSSTLDVGGREFHGAGGAPHEHRAHWGPQYSSSKLPKMDFPIFYGEDPKLWLNRCDDYFDMYSVEPRQWIRCAMMKMTWAVSRWLQSLNPKVKAISWDELCKLVLDRFGRDQYELLIRQLFHIRQSGGFRSMLTGSPDWLTNS